MYFSTPLKINRVSSLLWWQLGLASIFVFLSFFSVFAQQNINLSNKNNELVIDEIKDAEIFAFGKTIVIKKEAKGVLVFGGDVIIEGRVEGDVATIGGSVIQKENAYIGGDVIIFGGKYQHERAEPLREADKQTIMYAGYEEELRELTNNPSRIFSPQLTWSFLAWRLLSVLFWFVVSLLFITIAPGAISRAVARVQLSPLKIVGLGLLLLILVTLGVIASLTFLPTAISSLISLMGFVLVSLAYFFGRVSLQVSIGKLLQKHTLAEKHHSESLAVFIGTLILVFLLSLPYFWILAVILVFSASLGLVITGRTTHSWQSN